MKTKFSLLFIVFLYVVSCQDDTKLRILEQEKEAQKRDLVFASLTKSWNFNAQPINSVSQSLVASWAEWRIFLKELSQKPKSSIGAFQQKSKTLSKRAAELNTHIPLAYDKPEIKSRIAVIITKINAINLYIHLNQIPDAKIAQLVQEVNSELQSLQQQFDEIVRKSQVKMEDGESDMIRMLDTVRAIPSTPKTNITPQK